MSWLQLYFAIGTPFGISVIGGFAQVARLGAMPEELLSASRKLMVVAVAVLAWPVVVADYLVNDDGSWRG